MAARKTSTAIQSTGVGESKVFANSDQEGILADIAMNARHPSNCTVNGQPIPEHLHAMFPYELTDQGYAEANEGKEPARVSIVRDEVSQRIARRGEDLERGMDPFDASDPMRELVREHVPAGMHPKFLSKRKVDAEGTTRGYTICTQENGDPVSLGSSILGYMPEERAQAILDGFQEKSHEAQREMYGEDFDPRRPGRHVAGERVSENFSKQDELSRGRRGPSRSFENPDPQGSDLGLQGDEGEDFQL